MRKKFIVIFLSIFIVASTTISSFANPLLIPVIAPEVYALIASIFVGAGVTFQTSQDLNYAVRELWDYPDFQDEIYPKLELVVKNPTPEEPPEKLPPRPKPPKKNPFEGLKLPAKVVSYFNTFLRNVDFVKDTSTSGINKFSTDFPYYEMYPNHFAEFTRGQGSISNANTDVGTVYHINVLENQKIKIGKGFTLSATNKGDDFWLALDYEGHQIYNTLYNDFGCNKENLPVSFVGGFKGTYPGAEYFVATCVYGNGYGYANPDKFYWNISGNYALTYFLRDGFLYSWVNHGNVEPAIQPDEVYTIPHDIESIIGDNPDFSHALEPGQVPEVAPLKEPLIEPAKEPISDPIKDPDKETGKDTDKETAKDPDKETDKDKDTETSKNPLENWDIFPKWGDGINFKPVTQDLKFQEKFPFCLPSDLKGILNIFDVKPKAPKFTVPIFTEKIELDLTQFNEWANILRFFILIGFVICLINITRRMIG